MKIKRMLECTEFRQKVTAYYSKATVAENNALLT